MGIEVGDGKYIDRLAVPHRKLTSNISDIVYGIFLY